MYEDTTHETILNLIELYPESHPGNDRGVPVANTPVHKHHAAIIMSLVRIGDLLERIDKTLNETREHIEQE